MDRSFGLLDNRQNQRVISRPATFPANWSDRRQNRTRTTLQLIRNSGIGTKGPHRGPEKRGGGFSTDGRLLPQDRAEHVAYPLLLRLAQAEPHRQPDQTLRQRRRQRKLPVRPPKAHAGGR